MDERWRYTLTNLLYLPLSPGGSLVETLSGLCGDGSGDLYTPKGLLTFVLIIYIIKVKPFKLKREEV
jgi:hypothetical protein